MWFERCVICTRPARGLCPTCRGALQPPQVECPDELDSLGAVFAYEGIGASVIRDIKYANRRAALGPLIDAIAPSVPPADLVVPVPVHGDRRRQRGYSLPDVLGDRLARRLRIPTARPLQRLDRRAQTNLPRAERLEVRHRSETVVGRVVLVDDVVTTGSTLASCARALRGAGAVEIHGIVLAATGNSSFDSGSRPNVPIQSV